MNQLKLFSWVIATLVVQILFVLLARAEPASTRPQVTAKTLTTFDIPNARQGIAVDAQAFYAINNYQITKHEKNTGKQLAAWDGKNKLIHMDSGMIWNGALYASHSNYPGFPMTSSVEVWQTESLTHVNNHSFGIQLGSFTWLDRHNGFWWGAFGNYDVKKQGRVYGATYNTQVVKMDENFQILAQWTYPEEMLNRFRPMSNSGGSWGPDGLLYLTGHDHAEVYAVKLPDYGSELKWVATILTPDTAGQGIAWDRSTSERILWGIKKAKRQVVKMAVPSIPISAH